MRKLHTGNGNPPPKDDPTKKPERRPAQPVGTDPVETDDTTDK